MYIRSNMWSTPIWRIGDQGTKEYLINSKEVQLNTRKLSKSDAIDLREYRCENNINTKLFDKEIINPELDTAQTRLQKYFGPLHKENIQWDEIERQLASSFSQKHVSFITDNNGQERPVDTFGSIEFIDRFIVTESSIKEKLAKVYSGSELELNIEKFNEVANRVKNQLFNKFSSEFASFFDKGETLENSFNISSFKKNLDGIFTQKLKDFQLIQKKYNNDWKNSITFGNNNIDFGNILQNYSNTQNTNPPQSLEKMSYSEIDIVFKTMQELKQSAEVNALDTNEIIGAHFGIAQSKVSLVIKYGNLSESVKESLDSISNHYFNTQINSILQKRSDYIKDMSINHGITPKLTPIDSNSILQIAQEFSSILNSPKRFSSGFKNAVDRITKDYIGYSTDYNNLPGYINPARSNLIHESISDVSISMRYNKISDVFYKISTDWNSFINRLDLEDNNIYYIPDDRSNLIDFKI